MKSYFLPLVLLFTIHLTVGQVTTLIDEDFSDGIPSDWTHCSGNWGTLPQWNTVDSVLTIQGGPYFARVLDGIQLPAVDLSSIENPILEFDLNMIEIDTNIQFTIYYSSDSMCLTEWDLDAGFHDFSNKDILASYRPDGNNLDYRHFTIDLNHIGQEPKVFFTLTADCMNYMASGVWQLNHVAIKEDPTLNTQGSIADIDLTLSPNPVSHTLTVSGVNNDFNYTVINTTGNKVLTGLGKQIDVSNLPNGLYYLVSEQQRYKFIKE